MLIKLERTSHSDVLSGFPINISTESLNRAIQDIEQTPGETDDPIANTTEQEELDKERKRNTEENGTSSTQIG
jgi:hypothetical protein